jgi:site-specific recombinase XerC
MRAAGETIHGQRLRGLIVVLWRAGLRISEALALTEADLDPRRGAVLVRRGKGGRRREVGMDDWAWEQLQPWLTARLEFPVGPLFCVIIGPTRGRRWSSAAARAQLRDTAAAAGVRRRFAPTSCATRTRSNSPTRVYRWWSSNANSATAISGSGPCTCREWTIRRSSRPCMPGGRRWSRST